MPNPVSDDMVERGFKRPLILFRSEGEVHTMALPDGFRFVAFIHGDSPYPMPIAEPGFYEIDIPELLARGRFPVGISTVDLAHLPAMQKLPAHVVGQMLDAADAALSEPTEVAK